LRPAAAASPRVRVHEPALLAARRADAAQAARGAPRRPRGRADGRRPPRPRPRGVPRRLRLRADDARRRDLSRGPRLRARPAHPGLAGVGARVLKVPYTTGYLSEHFADDDYATLAGYERHGGYQALRRVLAEVAPGDVIELVKTSGLQGRGGAGFPTGMKWSFMPKDASRPKYLVCNADESEPGSFKDRILMERGPHQLLEGILIGAWATGAEKTFVYVRGEYAYAAGCVQRAIDEAYAAGLLGAKLFGTKFSHDVGLALGAGAYIAGEETGLLESLEGKKAQPRKKPPFPAQHGAFGMPTTVNNVETFSHVPHILRHGAAWFRGFGTEKSPGTTLFGVSGHVRRPGLYELPLGTRLDEIVFQHAGG